MIELKNISKAFGGLSIFKDFSVQLGRGRIYGLVGPNGSGKTTLLNIINGQVLVNNGEIFFNKVVEEPVEYEHEVGPGGYIISKCVRKKDIQTIQQNITLMTSRKRAQLGIHRVWQKGRVFANLTVLENLLVSGRIFGEEPQHYLNFLKIRKESKKNKEVGRATLERIGLNGLANTLAGELSLGQQKLLAFGRVIQAIELRPATQKECLILIDEPFAGVHSELISKFRGQMLAWKEEGHTLLVVEHIMTNVEDTLDEVIDLGEKMSKGANTSVLGVMKNYQ